MIDIPSQFYLHTNGEIIYKPRGGVDAKSTFVVHVWDYSDIETPIKFLQFLKEAYIMGAKKKNIEVLGDINDMDGFIGEDWKEFVFSHKMTILTPRNTN